MIKKTIKKWFTLTSVMIYSIIFWMIIIPLIMIIFNLIQYTLWWYYMQNTLQYVNNFINERTSQMVYIKNKNQTFWEDFSNVDFYWKTYWDTITEQDIKSFPFYSYIKNKYKVFQDNTNITINYFNISSIYLWQPNINSLRNIFLSWKYKDKWFICKWVETYDNNYNKINTMFVCKFWIRLYIEKQIKNNVYKASFIYKQANFVKSFYIINKITDKNNNF